MKRFFSIAVMLAIAAAAIAQSDSLYVLANTGYHHCTLFNHFYNRVCADIPGYSLDELELTVDRIDAKIEKDSIGWVVLPARKDYENMPILQLWSTRDNERTLLTTLSTYCTHFPSPHSYLSVLGLLTDCEFMSRKVLLRRDLRLKCCYGPGWERIIKHVLKTGSFEVCFPDGTKLRTEGDQLTQEMRRKIRRMKKGELIWIRHIECVWPDGKSCEMLSLTFELTD